MHLVTILAHLFIPKESNNHKAKILHASSLVTIMVLFVSLQIGVRVISFPKPTVLGYSAQISTSEVIRLTNEKRAQAGLSPVTYNSLLEKAAQEKAKHMIDHDYWAHVAPDGTEPWYFFKVQGYKYRYAGENLARDFSNPSAAVDAWMASPSHRENMLSSKYSDIGIAVIEGDLSGSDTTIIVQLFGTTLAGSNSTPIAKADTQNSPTPTKQPVASAQATVTVVPTETVTPTPTEIPFAIAEAQTVPSSEMIETTSDAATGTQLFLSQFETTKGISMGVLGLLLIVTVIDGIVIASRKVKRVGGRSFAHFAFFGMILVVVLIIRAGKIL